jgi:hypothetical protein
VESELVNRDFLVAHPFMSWAVDTVVHLIASLADKLPEAVGFQSHIHLEDEIARPEAFAAEQDGAGKVIGALSRRLVCRQCA